MNSGNGFFFLLETWLFLPATEGSVQPATNINNITSTNRSHYPEKDYSSVTGDTVQSKREFVTCYEIHRFN